MIVRIWSTGIDRTRAAEYRDFEQQYSLPMFRQQRGFLGVAFLRSPGGAAALTLWERKEDITRLAESSTYRETVQRLQQTGLLRGEQTVEVFELASLHFAVPPTTLEW